jgi:hypothetical protein
MKTLLRIQFALLVLVLALSFCLTSCSLIVGLRQTNPNGYTPSIVEKWWMEQNTHRNSHPD